MEKMKSPMKMGTATGISKNYPNSLLMFYLKFKMFVPVVTMIILVLSSCKKHDPPVTNKFPADVAMEWMKLNGRLTQSTPGFNSVVSSRSMGYAGITLYVSIAGGSPGSASLLPYLNNVPNIKFPDKKPRYWPAAANAAMALITKKLFGNASPAGIASIDSLEASFTLKFQSQTSSSDLKIAENYGQTIATAIFEWSKTDGAHEAYLHVTEPGYIPPTVEGSWVPTFPAFSAPIHPYWGKNRPFFVDNIESTQPPPPVKYSSEPNSPFYQMVNELYTISLSLSSEDSVIARYWADIPGNLNVPAHATNIVTQLIALKKPDLERAALIYAKHGIAVGDACISVFKTKYQYNLTRPISYIRTVMGHPNWNTVVPTPPHPEYTAAHAVLSSASATVMEYYFGKNYHFTDRSYENVFGARSFNSFEDYSKEAGRSRLLAGIHYAPSIAAGLIQGRKVGELVNGLHHKGAD